MIHTDLLRVSVYGLNYESYYNDGLKISVCYTYSVNNQTKSDFYPRSIIIQRFIFV